jgi:hypothetical protein
LALQIVYQDPGAAKRFGSAKVSRVVRSALTLHSSSANTPPDMTKDKGCYQ